MKVKDAQFFTVVSSFLNVYLVKNRSCSSNTVKSYEDALNLLFTFLEGTKDIPRQRVNKTRVVPILPKTAEHLRSYLKKFHPAENRKRDDYVFYAYGGPQRPMSPDTVAAFVKKYGESARHVCTSIPERVHPHMLRHTRAMHLYQDGVPLAMVSEFLGHAQIETTKIYAHADTEMKRKAIQQAANKLNDTIPDALWNTDDEEMMLKLRGKQQYK